MIQVEWSKEMEARITEAAAASGLGVETFVREMALTPAFRRTHESTFEDRQKAVQKLSTFARDRQISLQAGDTIESIREQDGRR